MELTNLENILDNLIWEILQLKTKANTHTHFSHSDVIFNMPPNRLRSEFEKANPFYEQENLRNTQKELEGTINQFDQLKKLIFDSPCPIIEMRKKLVNITTYLKQIDETEKIRLEQLNKEHPELVNMRDNMLKDIDSMKKLMKQRMKEY